MFGLFAVPVILAVGSGIDLARAYSIQTKMQSDLDASLIAAVKDVSTLDQTALKQKITDWFLAQGNLTATAYSISDVSVNTTNQTVSAKVSAAVPTAFMSLAGIKNVPITVLSTAKGPGTSYVQVYIVLDKSSSMMLPSSQSDRTALYNLIYNNSYTDKSAKTRSYTRCEFACHDYDGVYFKYNNKLYDNIYALIRGYESKTGSTITLRTDTAVKAAKKVISMVSDANATVSHIKVGLYYFGDTLYEAVAPTSEITTLNNALTTDSYNLTSASSLAVSYFQTMMTELGKKVGTPGNGNSANTPLKLVLLLTDGVQSTRPWVTDGVDWSSWDYYISNTTTTPKSGAYWNYVAPMNPAWCSPLKTNGVTIGVLNTEYLAIPYDWGYVATLGNTMASTQWKTIWGGVMRTGVSSTIGKRDYLQYALEDCASSKDLFISASDQTEIESGLSALFNSYMNAIRLTQ